jgi:hypothetical protein
MIRVAASEGAMRPKKHETTGSGDLFRARLDQIIKMRHELVQLAGKIDWDFNSRSSWPLAASSSYRPNRGDHLMLTNLFAVTSALDGSADRRVADLDAWIKEYNEARPHQGVGASAKPRCRPSWMQCR